MSLGGSGVSIGGVRILREGNVLCENMTGDISTKDVDVHNMSFVGFRCWVMS